MQFFKYVLKMKQCARYNIIKQIWANSIVLVANASTSVKRQHRIWRLKPLKHNNPNFVGWKQIHCNVCIMFCKNLKRICTSKNLSRWECVSFSDQIQGFYIPSHVYSILLSCVIDDVVMALTSRGINAMPASQTLMPFAMPTHYLKIATALSATLWKCRCYVILIHRVKEGKTYRL